MDQKVGSGHSRTSINVTIPNQPTTSEDPTPRVHNISPAQSAPVKATTSPIISSRDVSRIVAARAIERCWMRYRDRQMFKLLKHAVCAAEHSLTYEILRKVAPKEAEFFRDPSTKIKVRFRFGGMEFPPEIYFKIFSHTEGQGLTYLSGKRVIKAGTEAARDACDLMGHRRFLDQVIQDAIHHEQFKVTDEIDVTTVKDYMQYLSHLDETPAEMGGRYNTWRKLTLGILPRTTIFYDLVDYAYSKTKRITPRLKKEIPNLLSRPVTQDVQHDHIRIISQLRSPIMPDVPQPTPKSQTGGSRLSQTSSRRSKQARLKAMKMRKMYGLEKEDSPGPPTREVTFMTEDGQIDEYVFDGSEEEWEEEEARELYQWTQGLKYDDIMTPRLPTSTH